MRSVAASDPMALMTVLDALVNALSRAATLQRKND